MNPREGTPAMNAKPVLFSAAACAVALSGAARADLMLYPTRVVIGPAQRSATVEIVNRGDKAETYRIAVVNRRMSETGEIVEAKPPMPGEAFADAMVVYTPRQVTLQPGQAQTVRVSVRRPAGLADGEYRSHLQFDRVADVTADTDIESVVGPAPKGQVAIRLQALIGASIPVIVRQGATSANVTLGELALVPGAAGKSPALAFAFHRSGNQSTYGDITVTWVPVRGKPVGVGKVAGVAVYVPNPLRRAQVPLTLPAGTSLSGGRLKLTYSERPEAGGRVIAAAELDLP